MSVGELKREVRCPECGGRIEQRGDVRFYEQGRVLVASDGKVEWVSEGWTTPVETLELDEWPFVCLECGIEFETLESIAFPNRSKVMGCGCAVGAHDESDLGIEAFHEGEVVGQVRDAMRRGAVSAQEPQRGAGWGQGAIQPAVGVRTA